MSATMGKDDLAFAGMARQAELVRAREVSARELVELYLERIERLEPKLNAFRVVLAESALAEADAVDGRVGAGEDLPLAGVPMGIKDTQDIAGEITALGTAAVDEPAREDSRLVRALRAAGAIVVGKTNLPELATSGFTESDTWGITRNPWDLDKTPNGSSGGSGAAVAAGLVAGATASDGAGSIRGPAAFCNLFGLKPQHGRIPIEPERHWRGLSVSGALTRTVADSALFFDVTARSGEEPGAPPSPARPFSQAAASAPARLRVAVTLKAPRLIAPPIVTDEVMGAVTETASLLESLGHSVAWRDPRFGQVGNACSALYLGGIHDDFTELPHPERTMRYTKGLARLGGLYPEAVLRRAERLRAKHAARINRIFDDHDVLLTGVVGEPPFRVGRWAGQSGLRTVLGMSRVHPFNLVWNYLGNPAAAVPAGFTDDGLPLSVQIVGPPNSEETLLSLSAQLEAERGWPAQRPPIS